MSIVRSGSNEYSVARVSVQVDRQKKSDNPTEPFRPLELQNLSHDVPELLYKLSHLPILKP